MVIGSRDLWKLRLVRSAMLYWGFLIAVMSFVFPFAGAQGGTFHSSAALMPTLWMVVPFGLRTAVAWVGERRDWNIARATSNFGSILVILAAIFTAGVYFQRVFGLDDADKNWGTDSRTYKMLGETLLGMEPEPEVVMVNNPPGFFATTDLYAVVVPSGGVESLKMAMSDFGVNYLVLDRNHPSDLAAIYSQVEKPDWLILRDEVNIGRSGPILIFQSVLSQELQ
jgi:hypothetical protein